MIDTYVAGDLWNPSRDNLAKPQGVIAQGIRTSNKVPAPSSPEGGVMRLDNVALLGGRSYMVTVTGVRIAQSGTQTVNDHYTSRIRLQTDGTAATTASTEIGRMEVTIGSAATSANDSVPMIVGWTNPSADALTSSVIFTFVRNAGTATPNIQAADPGGIVFSVVDMGIAVANTVVNL